MNKVLKIISIIFTILLIGILIYCLIVGNNKNDIYYSSSLMKQYKSKESRLNYFENNKESFIYIADFFDKYEDVQRVINIENNEICKSKEIEIKLNDKLSLCSTKKIDEELDKDTLLNNINNLKDIHIIRKENVINYSNKEAEKSVSFYISESSNTYISFNFCLNDVECNTSDEYTERDNKIFEKNKIDEDWNTIYSN